MSLPDAPEGVIDLHSRWPKGLHQQLKKAAREACRSVNSEVVWRLKESFRSAEVLK
jgi:hypothetical protein